MSMHCFRVAAFAACLFAAPGFADPAEGPALYPTLNHTKNAAPHTMDAQALAPEVPDAAVQAQGPTATSTATSTATPTATPVPTPVDVASVPREALEQLASDLALENLLLSRRLIQAQASDATRVPADTALPEDLPQLDAAIAALEEQLLVLELRRAALTATLGEAKPGAGAQLGAGALPGAGVPVAPAAGHAAGAVDIQGAAEGSAPYRYRYSFGLIGHSGRARIVVRRENGALRSEGYNFSEFRDDAVWVKLLFRNDGDTPQRFTGVVALGGRGPGVGRERIRVLATVSLRTPVLQPGEILEIDREIRVDKVRDVDWVEVGRVRSFPLGQ